MKNSLVKKALILFIIGTALIIANMVLVDVLIVPEVVWNLVKITGTFFDIAAAVMFLRSKRNDSDDY